MFHIVTTIIKTLARIRFSYLAPVALEQHSQTVPIMVRGGGEADRWYAEHCPPQTTRTILHFI